MGWGCLYGRPAGGHQGRFLEASDSSSTLNLPIVLTTQRGWRSVIYVNGAASGFTNPTITTINLIQRLTIIAKFQEILTTC